MSNINALLEGSNPYKALSQESAKLAGKWEKSGLLEGIENSTEKNNMSMLLENQAKQLVNENNVTGTGQSVTAGANSEAWAGVALPLVRRVFGEIVAKDLVSVQPMNLPAGLIFYLDFQYGTTAGGRTLGESLYGATDDQKRTESTFDQGLYGAGRYNYSTGLTSSQIAAIGEGVIATDDTYITASIHNTAAQAVSSQDSHFQDILLGDTEFSASHAGQFATTGSDSGVLMIKISTDAIVDHDPEAVKSFDLTAGNPANLLKVFKQFTRINGSNIEFVISSSDADNLGTLDVLFSKGPDNLDDRGDFEDRVAPTSGAVSTLSIPEINVQLRSDTVAAKTRKLKAQWTPEFAQDLNAYHSIDAEAELTSMLSEYISMEIDLEILDMLMTNADTIEGWSATVAKDLVMSSNHTTGGTTFPTMTTTINDAGVYYTKMSWFQTLGIKLQKVSNIIHQKTLRGGANFMVVSPKVSTILESLPGFAADSAGDSDKYAMGVQKLGAINNRYTVYKNPYMTENVILMGYKGSQFLETGAVFAPYIPLIMTPLVYDPASFTPRKGIMTRYAKKMVRPDFYGKVYIQDLNDM